MPGGLINHVLRYIAMILRVCLVVGLWQFNDNRPDWSRGVVTWLLSTDQGDFRWTVTIILLCFGVSGGSERADTVNSSHLQRSVCLPCLLAALQYHGSQSIRRKIQQMHRQQFWDDWQPCCWQQVCLPGATTSKLHVVYAERQFQQCSQCVSCSFASGTFISFCLHCILIGVVIVNRVPKNVPPYSCL